MIPDRELDALIAEKVMGWESVSDLVSGNLQGYPPERHHVVLAHVPHYSTDIAAAWSVVENLLQDGWRIDITSSEVGGTDVVLECISGARGRFASDMIATTASHAVCLAALRAYGFQF